MAVGFFIDPVFYKIGTGDFLNSFFSTIYIKLENSNWGDKYPLIMNDLHNGKLTLNIIEKAKKELNEIKAELSKLPPNEIVWDYEDTSILPPWGNSISPDIKNMSEYFVTSDGKK